MVRHIIFNGFHPVFPWCAFLLLGMWLGRQNLTATIVRKKILVWCLSIWGITELTFFAIRAAIGNGEGIGLTVEEMEFFVFNINYSSHAPVCYCSRESCCGNYYMLLVSFRTIFRKQVGNMVVSNWSIITDVICFSCDCWYGGS